MHDFSMLTNADDPRLPKLFGRHVVAITVSSIDRNGEASCYSFSGFFVVLNDVWYLLMAGHVVADLRTLPNRGETIECWDVTDSFADGPSKRTVVIDVRLDEIDSLPYLSGGSDLAWIAIHNFHIAALQSNGIEPIDMGADFRRLAAKPFDMLVLAGIPTQKVVLAGASGSQALLTIPADLLRLDQVSNVLTQGTERRIYAQLERAMQAQSGVTDIAGMSGGPIFALWISPDRQTFDYTVVAIQSAWDPKTLQIAGWPLDDVAAEMARASDT